MTTTTQVSSDLAQRMSDMERMYNMMSQQINSSQTSLALAEIRNQQREVRNQQRFNQYDYQIAELQAAQLGNRVAIITNCVCAGTKIIAKLGSKEVVFQIGKLFSVALAKRASYITAAKVIPAVSVIIGVGLAIFRVIKGYRTSDKTEYGKACAEMASGIFACFPGWGTGVSVALDVSIVVHDVYKGVKSSSAINNAPINNDASNNNNASINSELTLEDAYQGLGITSQEPTRDEVGTAYRNLSRSLHPDVNASVSQDEFNELQQFLNACKETIYREHNWN